MENPRSNNLLLFLSGEKAEEVIINETKYHWKEIRGTLYVVSKYLLQFKDPANRRNALFLSTPITQRELMRILRCGSSTVKALLRPSTQDLSSNIIARFAIIYRVTYSWVFNRKPDEYWDFHNFQHLHNPEISVSELIEKLEPNSKTRLVIEGYVLYRSRTEKVYLRLEKRPNITVIDLMNPSIEALTYLFKILNKVNCRWRFQQMPSITVGHNFVVFFGDQENGEDEVKELLREEYPLIKWLHNLPPEASYNNSIQSIRKP